MITIVQKEDPILRKTARAVPKAMFGTPELKKIIADMKAAIESQDDAVAIAAPQIGASLRIFVVSGRIFDMLREEAVTGEGTAQATKKADDMIFINPKVLKLSKDRKEMEEGCLSVRYLYGKVSRARKATVRAMNESGKAFEIDGTGLLAQIFQHENDHLDGVLFIDSATDLEDLPPDEIERK
ncbi:MAG TPA: peptide deformylase [Candidatus Paceibacterota bacterium]|nr:peptide deformylase [Candidatus Paceibacterota bacterium]